MLFKTHLMFGILASLIFVSFVSDKLIFAAAVLFATILPDIDHHDSKIGKPFIFRPLQLFTKHRGIFHSIFLAILLSALIAIFFPIASFGFFLGYSVHLLCDSFTVKGITPFWPFKSRNYGILVTGGKFEEILFISAMLVDIILFLILFIH